MTVPVFLCESLAEARPGELFTLDGPEGRHAVSVRRLRVGEEIILTDGQGASAFGTVEALHGKEELTVEVTGLRQEPPPRPRITVVQALPKGDRGELAVETMTETGVDAIIPWAASRCVTRWKGERAEKALAKWRATAREAGKQSRRVRLPDLAGLASTDEVVRLLSAASFAAVLHEESDSPLATAALPAEGDIVLVVGPEGGISPAELTLFAEAGARPCRLGSTVLRTSTAGTAATAVLLARTGRWG